MTLEQENSNLKSEVARLHALMDEVEIKCRATARMFRTLQNESRAALGPVASGVNIIVKAVVEDRDQMRAQYDKDAAALREQNELLCTSRDMIRRRAEHVQKECWEWANRWADSQLALCFERELMTSPPQSMSFLQRMQQAVFGRWTSEHRTNQLHNNKEFENRNDHPWFRDLMPQGVRDLMKCVASKTSSSPPKVVMDLGMGHGAMALQLWMEYPDFQRIIGIELSRERFDVAASAMASLAEFYRTSFSSELVATMDVTKHPHEVALTLATVDEKQKKGVDRSLICIQGNARQEKWDTDTDLYIFNVVEPTSEYVSPHIWEELFLQRCKPGSILVTSHRSLFAHKSLDWEQLQTLSLSVFAETYDHQLKRTCEFRMLRRRQPLFPSAHVDQKI
jgi:hypothetical protein